MYRTRSVLNAINLTTPLGLAVALIGGARIRRGPEGLVLAEGYRLRYPIAGAFTVGNVVTTASSFAALERRLPGTLGHESRHATQYAVLGPLFFPLYSASALVSWWRSGDPAWRNPFERHAGLVTGGYLAAGQSIPPRTGRRSLAGLFGRR